MGNSKTCILTSTEASSSQVRLGILCIWHLPSESGSMFLIAEPPLVPLFFLLLMELHFEHRYIWLSLAQKNPDAPEISISDWCHDDVTCFFFSLCNRAVMQMRLGIYRSSFYEGRIFLLPGRKTDVRVWTCIFVECHRNHSVDPCHDFSESRGHQVSLQVFVRTLRTQV